MSDKEFGTEWIDDHIICPHCGYKYESSDSYEIYSEHETSTDCNRCGKEFNYCCKNLGVSFSTFKPTISKAETERKTDV